MAPMQQMVGIYEWHNVPLTGGLFSVSRTRHNLISPPNKVLMVSLMMMMMIIGLFLFMVDGSFGCGWLSWSSSLCRHSPFGVVC